MSEDKELEDLFIAPFAVPKAPQRFYYLFGKPIKTSRADLDDPARVGHLYRQVSADSPPVLSEEERNNTSLTDSKPMFGSEVFRISLKQCISARVCFELQSC